MNAGVQEAEERLQAALALGEFTDLTGVVTALGFLALEADELLDLRYSAFTSLGRAGLPAIPDPQDN